MHSKYLWITLLPIFILLGCIFSGENNSGLKATTNIKNGSIGAIAREEIGFPRNSLYGAENPNGPMIWIWFNKKIDSVASENAVKADVGGVKAEFKTFPGEKTMGWGETGFAKALPLPDGINPIGKFTTIIIDTSLTAVDKTKIKVSDTIKFMLETKFRLVGLFQKSNLSEINEYDTSYTDYGKSITKTLYRNIKVLGKARNMNQVKFQFNWFLDSNSVKHIHITDSTLKISMDSHTKEFTIESNYSETDSVFGGPNYMFQKNYEYRITIDSALTDIDGDRLPYGYDIRLVTTEDEF